MNNPISDLYIKFMESVEPYIKKFPYLFLILAGLLFVLAAIFNWKWLLNPNGKNFKICIYEMFGEMGVRIITGISGFIMIICSLILWIFSA